MLSNFRVLSVLCSSGALFILAGFFLTMLPILIQILFLVAGLITCAVTFYNVIRYYLGYSKAK